MMKPFPNDFTIILLHHLKAQQREHRLITKKINIPVGKQEKHTVQDGPL